MSTPSALDLDATRHLPLRIRFGSSSWTYPGWRGSIYHRTYRSEKEFRHSSLEEYARCPLFRTVGIDSFFYSPPDRTRLHHYASQLPADFRWVAKVWERITIPRYPAHPRYGSLRSQPNPDFLNAELFINQVASPCLEPGILEHVGPLVFQFPFIAPEVLEAGSFIERLGSFLSALPPELQYGVEVRNPEYLVPAYFEALNATGATHCFNHWHFMPPLREQMHAAARAGGLSAPFYVSRILTPIGVSYENAVKLFAPYDSVKRPNHTMRADVVRLAKRGLQRDVDAWIIVNNRAEGHSPGTIAAISAMISAATAGSTPECR